MGGGARAARRSSRWPRSSGPRTRQAPAPPRIDHSAACKWLQGHSTSPSWDPRFCMMADQCPPCTECKMLAICKDSHVWCPDACPAPAVGRLLQIAKCREAIRECVRYCDEAGRTSSGLDLIAVARVGPANQGSKLSILNSGPSSQSRPASIARASQPHPLVAPLPSPRYISHRHSRLPPSSVQLHPVPVLPPAEGDVPIPAELFDEDGELDLDHIFCSKCRGNESDEVGGPRGPEQEHTGLLDCPSAGHKLLGSAEPPASAQLPGCLTSKAHCCRPCRRTTSSCATACATAPTTSSAWCPP